METNNLEDALHMALELAFQKNIRIVYWNTHLDNIHVIRKIVNTEYFLKKYRYRGILDAVCKLSDETSFYLSHFSLDNEDIINIIQEKINTFGIKIMLIDYEEKDKELISKIEKSLNIPVIAVLNQNKTIKFSNT